MIYTQQDGKTYVAHLQIKVIMLYPKATKEKAATVELLRLFKIDASAYGQIPRFI
jgi:hypothetical protein